MPRGWITEAEAERMVDRTVWAALARDPAYLHASDAEAQSAREEEIAEEAWRDLRAKYDVL